jgi:hypothetical protein
MKGLGRTIDLSKEVLWSLVKLNYK